MSHLRGEYLIRQKFLLMTAALSPEKLFSNPSPSLPGTPPEASLPPARGRAEARSIAVSLFQFIMSLLRSLRSFAIALRHIFGWEKEGEKNNSQSTS